MLLINPPKRYTIWAGIPEALNKGVFLYPPLGSMYIQAYLEKYSRHKAILLDALAENLDFSEIEKKIKKICPDAVGITACTHSLLDVVKTIQAVKRAYKDIYICLGGPHVSSFSRESINLEGVDSVIPGDGEIVFKEILDSLEKRSTLRNVKGIIFKENGDIIQTGEAQYIKDLDILPFPKRECLKNLKQYYTSGTESNLMTTMITSRGCPNHCNFCNTSKTYRCRSPQNVVDEIEECIKLNIREFYFLDDTFNVSIKRVVDICNEILKRNLEIRWGFKARCDNVDYEMLELARKAGCRKIHYGVEAATDDALAELNKGSRINIRQIEKVFRWTKKLGMRSIAYIMVGCPYDKTKADILKAGDFVRKIEADYVIFSLFSPYPDTDAYRTAVEKGVIKKGIWEEFIRNPQARYDLPTCWEEHFSKRELLALLKLVHTKFYLKWQMFFNVLFGLHSKGEFKRVLRDIIALGKLFLIRKPEGKI